MTDATAHPSHRSSARSRNPHPTKRGSRSPSPDPALRPCAAAACARSPPPDPPATAGSSAAGCVRSASARRDRVDVDAEWPKFERQLRVNAMMPPFAAEYALLDDMLSPRPAIEARFTILPCLRRFISGITAWQNRNVPFRLNCDQLLPFVEGQFIHRGAWLFDDRAAADCVHQDIDRAVLLRCPGHDLVHLGFIERIRRGGRWRGRRTCSSPPSPWRGGVHHCPRR